MAEDSETKTMATADADAKFMLAAGCVLVEAHSQSCMPGALAKIAAVFKILSEWFFPNYVEGGGCCQNVWKATLGAAFSSAAGAAAPGGRNSFYKYCDNQFIFQKTMKHKTSVSSKSVHTQNIGSRHVVRDADYQR